MLKVIYKNLKLKIWTKKAKNKKRFDRNSGRVKEIKKLVLGFIYD